MLSHLCTSCHAVMAPSFHSCIACDCIRSISAIDQGSILTSCCNSLAVCRPQMFMPKELAASFKAINRLDLHALDDVTDKQLQDLAAAQHVPHEDSLLAEALRKLHGGSICSKSECPSVTGSLSRAESFDLDDNQSEAASSTATGMTPLRRRLHLPHRAAASLHSSKPSLESMGSPFDSTTKSSSSRLWLPPRRPDLAPVRPVTPSAESPSPVSPLGTPPDVPSSSQSPFTPPIIGSTSPRLQSFHAATSFSTRSHASSQQSTQRHRSGRRAKRLPHPQSQVCSSVPFAAMQQ